MRQLSVKGIVLGGITDIVATNIVAFPIIIIAALRANALDLPKEEQTRAVIDTLQSTPSLFVTQLVLGALCSMLGGYVAAKIAKRGPLLNGALSAFLCVGFGLYSLVAKTDALGPWAHAGFLVLSPALGAVGGWLWQRRRQSKGTSGVTPVAA
jgi:lysozyme family protein